MPERILPQRVATHVLALLAVTALVVASAASAAPIVNAPLDHDQTAVSDPALLPSIDATPDLALHVAAAVDVPPTATPLAGLDLTAPLPLWVRTIQPTPLWSASDASATAQATLPSDTSYLKPLGPVRDRRVQVYFPGDDSRPTMQGWVDPVDVVAAGLPAWLATPDAQPPSAGSSLPKPPLRVGDTPVPDVTAVHIAIIDGASGQLLYGELPNTQVPQASTTKIATTIVALERAPDLSQRIPITISASQMAARDGSSTMGIEPGGTLSLNTLLHGMMLPSGNDAAEQVAIALADSRDQYVGWMNQEAAALGLDNTHFINPSGMDAPGHYSSAYDMAMLARYAMRNATFRDLVSATDYTAEGFSMRNLNRLLWSYPGADGVKIGFTDLAQKTIVASATHAGHRVYVSLMHSEDLPGDCSQLFDWVWDNFSWS